MNQDQICVDRQQTNHVLYAEEQITGHQIAQIRKKKAISKGNLERAKEKENNNGVNLKETENHGEIKTGNHHNRVFQKGEKEKEK